MSGQRGGGRAAGRLGSPLMTVKNELLHGAVVRGELPTVRRLLDRHRADINTRNANGLSCLQLAILNGHTKLAEYLVQKGVDIHATDEEGCTALHDAALCDNAVLVRKLVTKGLSPLVCSLQEELPIDMAAGGRQVKKMLCDEMCQVGEVRLARQYYLYLGLDRSDSAQEASPGASHHHHHHPPRNHSKHANNGSSSSSSSSSGISYSSRWSSHGAGPAHSFSSPKFESKRLLSAATAAQSSCQVSRNLPTHATRLHPSCATVSDSSTPKANISTSTNSGSGHLVSGSPDLRSNTAVAGSSPTTSSPTSSPGVGSVPSGDALNGTGNHRNSWALSYKDSRTGSDEEVTLQTTAASSSREGTEEQSPLLGSESGDCVDSNSSNNSSSVLVVGSEKSLSPVSTVKPETQSPQGRVPLSGSDYRKNSSPQLSRASQAIKALHQHSSFQLQIGLSLQSQHFSSLDEEREEEAEEEQHEEDVFAAEDCKSSSLDSTSRLPASLSGSSGLFSRRKNRNTASASLEADWFLTAQSPQLSSRGTNPSPSRSRRNQHLLQKTVSFADLPMTRSKSMFVGQRSTQNFGGTTTSSTSSSPSTSSSSSSSSSSLTKRDGNGSSSSRGQQQQQQRAHHLGQSLSFSTNVLDRYISNYNPERNSGTGAAAAGGTEVVGGR